MEPPCDIHSFLCLQNMEVSQEENRGIQMNLQKYIG
jgi:hypothetical protein